MLNVNPLSVHIFSFFVEIMKVVRSLGISYIKKQKFANYTSKKKMLKLIQSFADTEKALFK